MLDERNVHRVWDRLRRRPQDPKYGVRPLGLHSARHTFASLALDSGRSIRFVADQLVQPYLNEFQFGFNKRWHEADLFPPLLRAAIDAGPFPYRHLTAEQTG